MTTLDPRALKPCPHCGCIDVSHTDNGDEEWFECDWCHATSGFDPDPAFEAEPLSFHWNRRAALSQPQAGEPVGYQQLKDGKWEECSEFVAKGWGNDLSPGTRAIYASEVDAKLGELAALEAESETLRKKLVGEKPSPSPQPALAVKGDDAKELADRITDYLTNGGLFNPEMMPHGPARDLPIDCRAALTAAIGAGGQAVAEPLKWEGFSSRSSLGDLYEVARLSAHVWQMIWNGTALPGWFPTEEQSKAAAQADYERRIRSALSQPHPAEERVVEALRAELSEAKDMANALNGDVTDFGQRLEAAMAREARLIDTLSEIAEADNADVLPYFKGIALAAVTAVTGGR